MSVKNNNSPTSNPPQASSGSPAATPLGGAERMLAGLDAVGKQLEATLGPVAKMLADIGRVAAQLSMPHGLGSPQPTQQPQTAKPLLGPAFAQPQAAPKPVLGPTQQSQTAKPLLGPAFVNPDLSRVPKAPPIVSGSSGNTGWSAQPKQEQPAWASTLGSTLGAINKTLSRRQSGPSSGQAPAESKPSGPTGPFGELAAGLKQMLSGMATFAKEATNAAGLLVGLQSVSRSVNEAFAEVRKVLAETASKIGGVAGVLTRTVATSVAELARATGVPSAAKAAGSWVAGKAKQAANWVGNTRIGKAVGSAMGHAKRVGKTVFARVGRAAGGAARAVGGAGKAALAVGKIGGKAIAGAASVGKKAAGMAGAGASMITGVVGGAIDAFKALTSQVMGFVEAFAPAVVEVFNQSLRDLTAVVGMALEPVMKVATSVVKDFSATLLPLMRDLRPVIEQVAATFKEVSAVAINVFATNFKAILPVIQLMADGLNAISPILQTVGAAFAGLVQATSYVIKGVLSGLGVDTKDMMGGLRTALEELSRYVLMASAAFLKLIHGGLGDSFIKGVKDAMGLDKLKRKDAPPADGMEPVRDAGGVAKEDATGMGAMRNASFANFADFGKQVALAASVAAGSGEDAPKTSEEWLKKISDSLDGIADMKSGELWDKLKDKIKEAVEAGVRAAADVTTHSIKEGGERVLGATSGAGGLGARLGAKFFGD